MSKKLYPTDTLKQAQSVLTAWNEIDPMLEVGTCTPQVFQAEMEAVNALKEKIQLLELELIDLRNQRDDACLGIWRRVKSVRSFMKGTFGDDSVQYKMAGGTPISEIKRKRRKPSTDEQIEPSPSLE